jgi:4-amino-4-deoxy-L-arabinose transferase-like glycosyltransferase
VSRGSLFYLPVLFSDSFPWSAFLPVAAWSWFVDRRAAMAATVEDERLAFRVRTVLWLWIVAIVVFFSFSAAKQDLYVFPIVPAVAALAGLFIARAAASQPVQSSALRVTVAAIGFVIALSGAGAIYVFQSAGKVYALDGAAIVGYTGAIGGMLILILALRNAGAGAMAIAAVLVALNWTFVLRVLPSFEQYKPVPPLSAAIRERAVADDVIVHYNVALPSMVYYLGRHVDVFFEPQPFLEALRSPRRVFAVLPANDYEELAPAMNVPTCVIDRRPTVNVKLRAVLAREPLPEVLLITNRCP